MSGTAVEFLFVKELTQFVLEVAKESEFQVDLELRIDSSRARQWTQRRGLGRLKHVDVRLCHLQDLVRNSVLAVLPVNTKLNVADLNTKKLSKSRRAFWLFYWEALKWKKTLLEQASKK